MREEEEEKEDLKCIAEGNHGVGREDSAFIVSSVTRCVLQAGATLRHSYVQDLPSESESSMCAWVSLSLS